MRSAVEDHITACHVCKSSLEKGQLTYRDFKIIKTGTSDYDILVKEALLIKKENPSLNRQLFLSGAFVALKVFN